MLKAENLQKFRDHYNNLFEQLEFKLEKIIGIKKPTGTNKKAFCFKNCTDLSLFE